MKCLLSSIDPTTFATEQRIGLFTSTYRQILQLQTSYYLGDRTRAAFGVWSVRKERKLQSF